MTDRTNDWTRTGVVFALAGVVGYLAHNGGYPDLVKSLVAALVALALGYLRSPTQHDAPTVTVAQSNVMIPIDHEEPKP